MSHPEDKDAPVAAEASTGAADGVQIIPAVPVPGVAVTRSTVPAGRPYREYLQSLRNDFSFACAYCTIAEFEAHGIRFTIDHYEPQNARPDLANEYHNLMYACDVCNTLKGDRIPPDAARKAGIRFFRPDQDVRDDHFQLSHTRLNGKTPVGEFSIEAIDLNRQALRKLRELRQRMRVCDEFVEGGLQQLTQFHIDRLPPNVRGQALKAIKEASVVHLEICAQIDEVLKNFARSPLLDAADEPDPDRENRRERLRELQACFPGNWRHRKNAKPA